MTESFKLKGFTPLDLNNPHLFFMICSLKGQVIHQGKDYILLEVEGVGYKIILPESVVARAVNVTSIFTHEVVREDSRDLFGFFEISQLELFWKLISISGVGPKIAQKLVHAAPIVDIRAKVMSGDLAFLTSIPASIKGLTWTY